VIAGVYDITMEQGSTFFRQLTLEQPDLVADPTGNTFVNYNLAGHTARMHIRRTVDSVTPMISLTTENGRISINPFVGDAPARNNEIFLTISAADTAGLTMSGVYDLEIVSSGNVVSKVVRGDVNLIPEVTR